jgi:renalase
VSNASDLLVIGAGWSGVTAAATAQQAGVNVQVVDRGRAIGGRMASRRLRDTGTPFDGRVVDYGASYFTVSDPDFRTVVEEMITAGVVRPWTDTFHVHTEGTMAGVKTGPMRYAAPAGLRSVVEYLAQSLSEIDDPERTSSESTSAPPVFEQIASKLSASRYACRSRRPSGLSLPGVLPRGWSSPGSR